MVTDYRSRPAGRARSRHLTSAGAIIPRVVVAPPAAPRLTRFAFGLVVGAVLLSGVQFSKLVIVDLAASDAFLGLAVLSVPAAIVFPPRYVVRGFTLVATGLLVGSVVGFARGFEGAWIVSRLVGWVIVALYFAAAYSASGTIEHRRTLTKALVAAAIVPNLLALALGDLWLRFFPRLARGRLAGGMYDFNSNATLLGTCLVLVLLDRRLFAPRARAVLVATLALLLVLTGSRGGLLMATLGIATGLLASTRGATSGVLKLGRAAVLAAVGLLTVSFFTPILDAFLANVRDRPDNIGNRFELIHHGLEMFVAWPVTGAGLGASREVMTIVIHSTLLGAIAEGGLLLAGGIVLVFASLLRNAWRARWTAAAPDLVPLLAAVSAMCVASFTIEASFQRHWWIVAGLLAAAVRETTWARTVEG